MSGVRGVQDERALGADGLGLASVDDIVKLKARKGVPVAGAVLGRALYNGAIIPAEALRVAA